MGLTRATQKAMKRGATMTKADTILEAVVRLRAKGYHATVFSTNVRLPYSLKGLPDLYLMKDGAGYWVEVKLRHANYMRDQMSDVQWQWYHNRRGDFGVYLRYAIVGDVEELLEWVNAKGVWDTHIPAYHYARYEQWKEENDIT